MKDENIHYEKCRVVNETNEISILHILKFKRPASFDY